MAESFYQYFLRAWLSPFRVHLLQALLVAGAIELLLFIVSWWLRRALAGALRRDVGREPSERIRRRRIVEGLPLRLSRGVLYTIGLLMVLRVLGLPTSAELLPVLALLVVAVLVLFRDQLRDLVRGYFIMYDYLYGPGDRVSLGNLTGVVTELTLRSTRLQVEGGEGREVVMPNRLIQSVVNHSRRPRREEAESGQ